MFPPSWFNQFFIRENFLWKSITFPAILIKCSRLASLASRALLYPTAERNHIPTSWRPFHLHHLSPGSTPQDWSFLLFCCSLQSIHLPKWARNCMKYARALGKQHVSVFFGSRIYIVKDCILKASTYRQEKKRPNRIKFASRLRKCSGLPWGSLSLPSLLKEMWFCDSVTQVGKGVKSKGERWKENCNSRVHCHLVVGCRGKLG